MEKISLSYTTDHFVEKLLKIDGNVPIESMGVLYNKIRGVYTFNTIKSTTEVDEKVQAYSDVTLVASPLLVSDSKGNTHVDSREDLVQRVTSLFEQRGLAVLAS